MLLRVHYKNFYGQTFFCDGRKPEERKCFHALPAARSAALSDVSGTVMGDSRLTVKQWVDDDISSRSTAAVTSTLTESIWRCGTDVIAALCNSHKLLQHLLFHHSTTSSGRLFHILTIRNLKKSSLWVLTRSVFSGSFARSLISVVWNQSNYCSISFHV